MSKLAAINFKKWIDDNRHLLKPPVSNKCVYTEANDFVVMVVGGPNARTDFHYNETEEFFYQIEGNIVLRVLDDGKRVEIPIQEGEIFLLPAKVPHSPQRPPNTIGLVMEARRLPGMKDGLIWVCDNCGEKVYEEYFTLTDIAIQLKEIIDKYNSNESLRTCKHCGKVMPAK